MSTIGCMEPISIKKILGRPTKGTGMRRQLTAAHTVHVANIQLQELLSEYDLLDAYVATYSRGVITINVINGIVSGFLREHETDFLNQLQSALPELDVKRIRYRIAKKRIV